MNSSAYRKLSTCRVCRGDRLVPYLDLGMMPLANRLLLPEEVAGEERFPLEVLFCEECGLSQLGVVVDPAVLFRHYVYRSSISATFREHCRQLARELHGEAIRPGDLVVDIASNDGTLLREFQAEGSRVVGVDPARNLARVATETGVPTLAEFWSPDVARRLTHEHGKAKAIIATNVLAHVDDVHAFLDAAASLLAADGTVVVESPHLMSLLAKTEFDTVYHEHLSYLLAGPVVRLFGDHGLHVFRIRKTEIHGGSVRFYARHDSAGRLAEPSVAASIEEETAAGLYLPQTYATFGARVEALRRELRELLGDLKQRGHRLAAFGASAKGNTLLNYCDIGSGWLDCIYDDTAEKQFKLAPGIHLPIVPGAELTVRNPEYLLILAWNFAREIIERTEAYRQTGGRYILPIPSPQIL